MDLSMGRGEGAGTQQQPQGGRPADGAEAAPAGAWADPDPAPAADPPQAVDAEQGSPRERAAAAAPSSSEVGPGDQAPWSAVDWVYGVVVQPRETFHRLANLQRPPLGLAIAVGIVVTATTGLVQGAAMVRELGPRHGPMDGPSLLPGDVAANPSAGLVVGTGLAVLALGMWFVSVAVFHLLADLLGGQGHGRRFTSAMGLSTVPLALSLPVEAMVARGGAALQTVGWVGSLAIAVWGLYLQYLALRATKGLSPGGAVAVLLLPAAMVVVLMAVLVALILMAVATGSG